MADYKLDYTAQEVNEKLGKVQEGGTGYIKDETIHTIDPKYLPEPRLPVFHLSERVIPCLIGIVEGAMIELPAEDAVEMEKMTKHEVCVVSSKIESITRISLALKIIEVQEDGTYIAAYAVSGYEGNDNGALPAIAFAKGGEYGDGMAAVLDAAIFGSVT